MSIVIAILGLGLLIALHEAGHLLLARLMKMRVETYSLGFGPRLWGFRRGDTDYRISALPLGGYCKIAGFTADEPAAQDAADTGAYMNKPAWRRALVIFAGPGVNYCTAFALIFILYLTAGFPDLTTTTIEVLPGGPAAAQGLKSGDRFLFIDDVPVKTFDDIRRELQKKGAPEVRRIRLDRGPWHLAYPVKPRADGTLSIRADTTPIKLPFFAALGRSARDVWVLNAATLGALWDAVRLKGAASLAGPIAIVTQTSEQVRRGISDFAATLAQISVGLALFNLLPIPALDGGRLVFLLGELFTGRKADPRIETALSAIGMVCLLLLVVSVVVFGDLHLGQKLFHKN